LIGLSLVLVAAVLAVPLVPLLAPAGSWVAAAKAGLHGAFWFLLKVGMYVYLFMWLRFTFPRYRFDQLMRLGWQFLVPLSIVNVMGIGLALALHRQWGWGRVPSFLLTTVLTLAVAGWLARAGAKKEEEHVIVGDEA
jgi:NADH-quinone oxidoreductase subunit H